MIYFLFLFCLSLGLIGVFLLTIPESSFNFARKYFRTNVFQYCVGIFSILVSVAFYFGAATAKLPSAIEIFSLFSLMGGVITLVLPNTDFSGLISWELKIMSPYGRTVGVIYLLISAGLAYTVL
jgi:hypothetical protein